MKNTMIAGFLALFTAGSVSAQALGGSIGVEITENATGDYVAETTLGFGASTELSVGTAFGGFSFESVDGGTLELDEWQIGVATDVVTVSFGDQGSLFVENDFEIVGGTTLAFPSDEHESLIADFGAAAVLVGFTDITSDITDIENVQVAYTLDFGAGSATGVVDYNVNTEDYALGVKADYSINADVAVGGIVTYDNAVEVVAYEANASYHIATVFINGDDTDWAQNVGVGVTHSYNSGLSVYAEGSYNIDAEDTTFGAGVVFKF